MEAREHQHRRHQYLVRHAEQPVRVPADWRLREHEQQPSCTEDEGTVDIPVAKAVSIRREALLQPVVIDHMHAVHTRCY